MARPSPYTEEQKTAILEAVKTSRKTGKWPDALKAAEEAGYKGGLQYLMKLAKGKKKSSKAKKATTAAAKAGKKRGRPKGSTNAGKKGPGRPKGTGAAKGAGLTDIDRIVAQMVEQRVGVVVAKAVAALDAAAQELKTL